MAAPTWLLLGFYYHSLYKNIPPSPHTTVVQTCHRLCNLLLFLCLPATTCLPRTLPSFFFLPLYSSSLTPTAIDIMTFSSVVQTSGWEGVWLTGPPLLILLPATCHTHALLLSLFYVWDHTIHSMAFHPISLRHARAHEQTSPLLFRAFTSRAWPHLPAHGRRKTTKHKRGTGVVRRGGAGR